MSDDIESAPRRRNCRLIIEETKNLEECGPIIGYAKEPLVSLYDACIPLVDTVYDILNIASFALKQTPEHPADNLTRDESASIRLYTMEWNNEHASLYFFLNRALKSNDRERLRPWYKYLKLFLTALAKIPCAPPQAVWRGVRQNVSDAFPRGAEITWWSFSSCTTMLTVLENELYLGHVGERTLFSIEVFNARNINLHSHFAAEDEILLLPGTHMEVRSELNPTSDLHIIHLRQRTPHTMLLEPPFEGAQLYPKKESLKHHWYRKKRYFIPISLFAILCIIAIIIGSVIGTRRTAGTSEPPPVKPIDGICAKAQWNQTGVTMAGGNGIGSRLDQLDLADGLFLDKNNTIYIVDSGNNRIMKWNNSASIGELVAGGNGTGNSTSQLGYPIDIVVDDNGTMYITDFYNNRVLKWFRGAKSGQIILRDRRYIGIGRDNEGFLYTSEWTNNRVVKWQKNYTSGQILIGGLDSPDRLFIDQNNSVYVADRNNHRIIKLVENATQNLVVAGGLRGKALYQLDYPRGVTMDKSGNVYIADTNNHRIMRWLSGAQTGTVIVGGRGNGSNPDQLNLPTDLQFDSYGNLYVSDSDNGRVQKFTIDTSLC